MSERACSLHILCVSDNMYMAIDPEVDLIEKNHWIQYNKNVLNPFYKLDTKFDVGPCYFLNLLYGIALFSSVQQGATLGDELETQHVVTFA